MLINLKDLWTMYVWSDVTQLKHGIRQTEFDTTLPLTACRLITEEQLEGGIWETVILSMCSALCYSYLGVVHSILPVQWLIQPTPKRMIYDKGKRYRNIKLFLTFEKPYL